MSGKELAPLHGSSSYRFMRPAQQSIIRNSLASEPIGQLVKRENGDAALLIVIGEAFATQHTFNGAKTAERYSESDIADVQINVLKIVGEYGFLTIEELREVFKNGMTGAYGDDRVYFSALSVRHWLNEYNKERREVMKRAAIEAEDENNNEPSAQEKEAATKAAFNVFVKWIDKQHAAFKEQIYSGTFSAAMIPAPVAGPYWYKRLLSLGHLDEPLPDKKKQYFEAAKLEVIQEIREDNRRRRIPQFVDADSEEVKIRARNLAMAWCVRDCVYNWLINDANYEKELLTSIN